MRVRHMRMTRYLILAVTPVLLLASCDPFELVEPRPNRPVPRQPGTSQNSPENEQGGSSLPRPGSENRDVTERYPMAERTANPNQVISPYAPFNVIDVTGFNSGQLARDPTNNKIFRIP